MKNLNATRSFLAPPQMCSTCVHGDSCLSACIRLTGGGAAWVTRESLQNARRGEGPKASWSEPSKSQGDG